MEPHKDEVSPDALGKVRGSEGDINYTVDKAGNPIKVDQNPFTARVGVRDRQLRNNLKTAENSHLITDGSLKDVQELI